MDNYKETFETWNKIAKIYQDKFMDLNLYDETYDFFCEILESENTKILEIGCGPGNITKYVLSKKPNLRIEGIDVAPKMVELAKINNPLANFKVMDTRMLNEINIKFDAIICGFCIPYLSETDCSKLIIDSKNILTKSGILYISFVEGDQKKSGFQSGSTGDRSYFYYHSLENLERNLFENNFELIKLFKVNYPKGENYEIHTVIVARKTSTLQEIF